MNSSSASQPYWQPDPARLPLSGGTYFATRAAQSPDLSVLAEILTDSFHSRSGVSLWFYPLLRLGIYEDLRQRLCASSPHYICLVATALFPGVASTSQTLGRETEIVGTVEMALRSPPPWQLGSVQYLYISNLAVRPECRRQGVAWQLLSTCDRIALEWGFQDIYLHVLENNRQARRLYCKAGYKLKQIEPSWSAWLLKKPRRLLLHKHLTKADAKS